MADQCRHITGFRAGPFQSWLPRKGRAPPPIWIPAPVSGHGAGSAQEHGAGSVSSTGRLCAGVTVWWLRLLFAENCRVFEGILGDNSNDLHIHHPVRAGA